jgi:hypothetical protein
MRQLINNPRIVLPLVGVAGLLFAWRYLPVDWGRKWEDLLLGEVARMGAEPEGTSPEKEIPATKLYRTQPKNLSPEADKMLDNLGLERALFPVPASPAEKKWQQQDDGPRFPEGLRLEAIYREQDRKVAIVSGLLVEEGDYVRGAKAIRIREGDIQGDPANRARVTFEWQNREQDLVIGMEAGEVLDRGGQVPAEPAPGESRAATPADALQGELERLQTIQKLLQNPSKLLEGSKQ